MFSHRMVTLNLPIQSSGIEGVALALSPPSPPPPPPPIAADRKSGGNKDDEEEDDEDVEVEEEGVLDELVD